MTEAGLSREERGRPAEGLGEAAGRVYNDNKMDSLEAPLGYALLFLAVFASMEAVAWLMHKYLMHGPLWVLHESHHRPRTGWFEKNDLFGIFFSIPSIILIYLGTHGTPALLAVGLGMTAYGG
jgi:beta-carotene 3-hydroxylase